MIIASTRQHLLEAMARNGGRVPPAMVMPTLGSIEELDAYVDAYKAQVQITSEDATAIAHRRRELGSCSHQSMASAFNNQILRMHREWRTRSNACCRATKSELAAINHLAEAILATDAHSASRHPDDLPRSGARPGLVRQVAEPDRQCHDQHQGDQADGVQGRHALHLGQGRPRLFSVKVCSSWIQPVS